MELILFFFFFFNQYFEWLHYGKIERNLGFLMFFQSNLIKKKINLLNFSLKRLQEISMRVLLENLQLHALFLCLIRIKLHSSYWQLFKHVKLKMLKTINKTARKQFSIGSLGSTSIYFSLIQVPRISTTQKLYSYLAQNLKKMQKCTVTTLHTVVLAPQPMCCPTIKAKCANIFFLMFHLKGN